MKTTNYNFSIINHINYLFDSTDDNGQLTILGWYYDSDETDEKEEIYVCDMNWTKEDCESFGASFNEYLGKIQTAAKMAAELREKLDAEQVVLEEDFLKYVADFCTEAIRDFGKNIFSCDVVSRSRRYFRLLLFNAPQLLIDNELRQLLEACIMHNYCTHMTRTIVEE